VGALTEEQRREWQEKATRADVEAWAAAQVDAMEAAMAGGKRRLEDEAARRAARDRERRAAVETAEPVDDAARHSREGTNDSESQRGFCPEVNHLSRHRRPVGLFLRKGDSIRL